MESSPIVERTDRCLELFEIIGKAVSSEAEIGTWVQNVQIRANLFTSKLGVFAAGSLSIDHRLRRNKTVCRGIIQILDAVVSNTENLLTALDINHTPFGQEVPTLPNQSPDADNRSRSETSTDSDVDDDDIEAYSEDGIDAIEEAIGRPESPQHETAIQIEKLCGWISENIDDLLRYATLIKQSSRTKANSRADRYSPPSSEDDSSDAEDDDGGRDTNRPSFAARFGIHAELVLRREFGPQRYDDPSLGYLKARLQSSMVRRWRRICYQHARAEHLAARNRTKAQQRDTLSTELPHYDAVTALAPLTEPSDVETKIASPKASTVVSHSAFSTATTLQSGFSISKVSEARSTTAKSASRVGGSQLSLPPIPACQQLDSGFVYDCQYCGSLPMTKKRLTSRTWRQHLWSDLLPYTCLYAQCSKAETVYATFHDWSEHTRNEHWKPVWICSQCTGPTAAHDTQSSFISHIQRAHATNISDAELLSVATYSRLESTCAECVICGSEEGIGDATQDDDPQPLTSTARQRDLHACMANHLESLALSCLPWHFGAAHNTSSDKAEGTDAAENASENSSSHTTGLTPVTPQTPSLSAGSLAAIALNAEAEGEESVLDMVLAWKVQEGMISMDDDAERSASPVVERSKQSGDSTGTITARVQYDFEPETPDGLRLRKGDSIRVTDDSSKIWWKGHCNGLSGKFPRYAVELASRPLPKLSADPYPMIKAAETGDTALLRFFLQIKKYGVNSKDKTDGQTALIRAAKNGHDDVVDLLLNAPGIEADLADSSGETPLSRAAASGHVSIVRRLLLEDVRPDSGRETPVFLAAIWGHTAVVETLLATNRVDVNKRQSTEKCTSLWWPARKGHEGVVRLLLSHGGIEVDAPDTSSQQTPLSVAAENGHAKVVEMLLIAGADATWKDNYELTALEWAARNGHEGVVQIMSRYGIHLSPSTAQMLDEATSSPTHLEPERDTDE